MLLVLWIQVPCAHLVCPSMTPRERFCCLLLSVLSHSDYSGTLYPFLTCCSYHVPSPPSKKKKVCITVWYGWETFWYNHTQALSMIDLPDCLDPFWPCCLQFSCTADKMLCQQTAGPACTESFERGKWGKAGQEISQPSAFHQETNVK